MEYKTSKLDGVDLVRRSDIELSKVWKYDEWSRRFLPVMSPKELPESESDVVIYAKFRSLSGHSFSGVIIGIRDVFCINIFAGGEVIPFNRNLRGEFFDRFFDLLCNSSTELRELRPDQLFPLQFETNIGWSERGYNDFKGEFNHPGH